jgi:hypothetical protein
MAATFRGDGSWLWDIFSYRPQIDHWAWGTQCWVARKEWTILEELRLAFCRLPSWDSYAEWRWYKRIHVSNGNTNKSNNNKPVTKYVHGRGHPQIQYSAVHEWWNATQIDCPTRVQRAHMSEKHKRDKAKRSWNLQWMGCQLTGFVAL